MESQIKSLMSAVSTLIALQIFSLILIVGGGGYLFSDLKQQLSALDTNSGRQTPPKNVEDWNKLTREHDAAQGPKDAQVVLIEFSDFQCPYCKNYTDHTRQELVALYGADVRMVFKHLPLEQAHPYAMGAAIAAQCASREGKFWEAHDQFFAQPNDLGIDALIRKGESMGLGRSYADCVMGEETKQEVQQDIEDALAAGIQGTPTFLINGKVLVGSRPASAFKAAIEEARASAR